ncbi:MAG: hypothetical protein LKF79_00750 [Solobacterium sp.]|nr:hypothetical protein [Solobacterium sp.]MCH4265155.1 hypothetical protein [Solobacterium sp.]
MTRTYSEDMTARQKWGVYLQYTRIVPRGDWKKYDRITRKEMIAEMLKYVKDPAYILESSTERQLRELEQVLSSPAKPNDFSFSLSELYARGFLIYESRHTSIAGDLVEPIRTALKQVDWDAVRRSDHINELLVGYVKACGVISRQVAVTYGCMVLQMSEEEVETWINRNACFRYYVFTNSIDYMNGKPPEITLNDHNLNVNVDDLLDFRQEHSESLPGMVPDAADCRAIFYDDMNTNIPEVKTFYDALSATHVYKQPLLDRIALADWRGARKELAEILSYDNSAETDTLLKYYDQAMPYLHSPAYNGGTKNAYDQYTVSLKAYSKRRRSLYTRQKEAHISSTDADQFYHLYFSLLAYVNRKTHLCTDINDSLLHQLGVNSQGAFDLAEAFCKDPHRYVSEFIKENPYHLSRKELELVQPFERAVRNPFFILQVKQEYTIFADDDHLYAVKGVRANIDTLLDNYRFPIMAAAVLLPFKDRIIFDGVFSTFPVNIGPNKGNQLLDRLNTERPLYKL